jgi:hypothetical protein
MSRLATDCALTTIHVCDGFISANSAVRRPQGAAMAEHAEELQVTGRLDALDFQTRTLRLKLANERVLSGTYSDDFEPILLEHPREWIQVRGEAALAEDGTPLNLDNITEIIEVDESPIKVTAFRIGQRQYRAARPLEFPVTFNPTEGIYTVTGDFHMMVSAETEQNSRMPWTTRLHSSGANTSCLIPGRSPAMPNHYVSNSRAPSPETRVPLERRDVEASLERKGLSTPNVTIDF